MPISVAYSSLLTVIETLGGVYVSSGDATVTFNGMDATATLTSATTPPATKYSAGRLTLSGGAGTIDLTSLPDVNGVAAKVDFTGLKVGAYKLRNLSTNANNIAILEGDSNGYSLHDNWEMTLRPGEEFMWKGVDDPGVPDVAGSEKTIDALGTGSQVLEFEFVAG